MELDVAAQARDHVDKDEIISMIEFIISTHNVPDECSADTEGLCGNVVCEACGCMLRKHILALDFQMPPLTAWKALNHEYR